MFNSLWLLPQSVSTTECLKRPPTARRSRNDCPKWTNTFVKRSWTSTSPSRTRSGGSPSCSSDRLWRWRASPTTGCRAMCVPLSGVIFISHVGLVVVKRTPFKAPRLQTALPRSERRVGVFYKQWDWYRDTVHCRVSNGEIRRNR